MTVINKNVTNDGLFPGSLQVMMLIPGLLMIPLCRVLNFQKFKFLVYPILAAVLTIFLCLFFNLAVRAFKKEEREDFCTIMPDGQGFSIPS